MGENNRTLIIIIIIIIITIIIIIIIPVFIALSSWQSHFKRTLGSDSFSL